MSGNHSVTGGIEEGFSKRVSAKSRFGNHSLEIYNSTFHWMVTTSGFFWL